MNEQTSLEDALCFDEITRQDVAAINKLEKECFTNPWSEQSILETIQNPICVSMAVRKQGEIIAYLFVYHIISEIQIMQIAVAPEYRRNGIASMIMERLIAYARDHDVETIYLEVRKSNTQAQNLYQKHQFKQTAVRRNYYDTPREDAVIMELTL